MGERASTQGEALLKALERGQGEGGVTSSGSGELKQWERRRGTELRTTELSTPQLKVGRGRALKRSKQQQRRAKGTRASSLGAQESRRGHSGERRECKV